MVFPASGLSLRIDGNNKIVFQTTYSFRIRTGKVAIKFRQSDFIASNTFWVGKSYRPKTNPVGGLYLPGTVLT